MAVARKIGNPTSIEPVRPWILAADQHAHETSWPEYINR